MSCWCKAKEKPKKLPSSPSLMRIVVVSRLNAEIQEQRASRMQQSPAVHLRCVRHRDMTKFSGSDKHHSPGETADHEHKTLEVSKKLSVSVAAASLSWAPGRSKTAKERLHKCTAAPPHTHTHTEL